MTSTIVVGFDGSRAAALALDAAIDIARAGSSHLHVVAAYRTQPLPVRQVPGEYVWIAQASARAAAALADAQARARVAGVDVEAHLAFGDTADAILDVARDVNADLIMVAKRGIDRWLRCFTANVPSRVVHHAPCATHIVETSPLTRRGDRRSPGGGATLPEPVIAVWEPRNSARSA